MMSILTQDIATTAFAFRGFNVTNLGRSRELLAHPAYGPLVARHLKEAGDICADVVRRPIDLVARVRQGEEPTLETYDEAIALIVAMEMAQIALVQQHYGVLYEKARMAFGYSLGELAALACGEVFDLEQALTIPVAMAKDCAELADGTTLGVLFSREPAIPFDDVQRMCLHVNCEGKGVIGVSAVLSPNTYLLIGQQDSLVRFRNSMHDLLPPEVQLRPNPNRWPPLHTPIVWQRNVPNRSAVMMHVMPGGFTAPAPPVLSLVTGQVSYNDFNAREILHRWVDHPQRLWDAVYGTLASDVRTVVHVGTEPNLIPATFKRLSDNVTEQASGRPIGRIVSEIINRRWLATLLPSRTALLRAPKLKHVVLEDWLLANEPPKL